MFVYQNDLGGQVFEVLETLQIHKKTEAIIKPAYKDFLFSIYQNIRGRQVFEVHEAMQIH